MPVFKFEGPDGRLHSIEGPEGSTPEQAFAALQEQMGVQAQQQEPIDYANMPAHAVAAHALSNAPKSALGVAQSLVEPILHPIETAKNLGHLGKGLASKGLNAAGIWEDDAETRAANESTADALGAFYKDRYGSEAGFKKALAEDPVGVVADLATFFTGGGSAAARLPGMVGRAGAVVRDTARAVDPVRRGGQVVGGVANAVVPEVLGRLSGQTGRVLQEGHEAGRTVNPMYAKHTRGNGTQTEPLDMAREGEKKLRAQMGEQYEAGMAPIMAQGGQVDYGPVYKSLERVRESVTHKGLAKDPDGAKILSEIEDEVLKFDVKAGSGLDDADALKQAVGNIWNRTKEDSRGERVASQAYHAIKAEIEKQAPAYADVNQGYSTARRELDDLKRTLSLGEGATNDTALRKLQSTMRNNAATSWQHRTNLIDELATRGGQPDLPAALAGQSSNAPMPRGLGQITTLGAASTGVNALFDGDLKKGLASAALLAASSPRVIGEASHALGRVRGILERAGLPQEQINRILFTAGELSQGEGEKKDAEKSKRIREILMRRAAADRGQ
jgi:hypothetical protein